MNMTEKQCFYCLKQLPTAWEPCQHCQGVYICSPHHENIHRPIGHDKCLPFKATKDDSYGRFLIATRDISPLEIVLLDQAVAIVPETSLVCLCCMKSLTDDQSFKCESCGFPVCSSECRTNDRLSQQHSKFECQLFCRNNIKLEPSDTSKVRTIYGWIAILRLILAQQMSDQVKNDVEMMESHSQLRLENSKDLREALRRTTFFFQNHLGLKGVSFDQVSHAYGVIRTNSMTYLDCKASGVYPALSICSHSCAPNLDTLVQSGSKFGCRASRFIAKGDQLTINYLPCLENRLLLRKELKKSWFFDCHCLRCQCKNDLGTYLSSPLCPKCLKFPLIPTKPLIQDASWRCDGCQFEMSAGDVLKMVEMAVKCEQRGLKSEDPMLVRSLIQDLLSEFHANYKSVLILKHHYTQLESGDLPSKLQFTKDLAKVVRVIEGEKSKSYQKLFKQMMTLKLIECKLHKRISDAKPTNRGMLMIEGN